MCNYLFTNVSGIFKEEYREIINKLEPVAVGEVVGKSTDVDVDTRTVPSFLMAYGDKNTSASSYIPPQKLNQIFTPPVVTKMLDCLEAETLAFLKTQPKLLPTSMSKVGFS